MDADRTPPDPAEPWSTGRRRGPAPPDPGGDPDPWRQWRRLRPRTVRGAAALGIAGAAVLLFPFLDDPDRWWVPVGLGFGTLVLLALLRLDRLLDGWAPHVAGLVLVGALVYGTARNPWAWGLAAAVGLVVAGALLLPRWKVLAAGVVLLVVSGTGYAFRSVQLDAEQARADARETAKFRSEYGVPRPQLALLGLDSAVVAGNPARVCWFAQPQAVGQIRSVTGAATCEDAVAVLHARVPPGARVTSPDRDPDPDVPVGGTVTVDGCDTTWAAVAGRELGRVVLTRTPSTTPTFQIGSFAPC